MRHDRSLSRRWLLIVLGLTAACGPPGWSAEPAHGQEPATERDGKRPGRVYVALNFRSQPVRGIIGIDPETGTWTQAIEDGTVIDRVSPDGARLAFGRINRAKRTTEMWVVEIDGDREPTRIGEKRDLLSWSPDGRQILTNGLENPADRFKWVTWRIDADGSHVERLPIPRTERVWDWSPDSRWLLSFSYRTAREGDLTHSNQLPVYVMRPDGKEERLVIPGWDGPAESGVQSKVLTLWPRFSPDGRSIIYIRAIDGDRAAGRSIEDSGIWVVDIDGSNRRRIFQGNADGRPISARYSPDGKRLAVIMLGKGPDDEEETTRIEIMGIDGQGRRPVPLPPSMRVAGLLDWRRAARPGAGGSNQIRGERPIHATAP